MIIPLQSQSLTKQLRPKLARVSRSSKSLWPGSSGRNLAPIRWRIIWLTASLALTWCGCSNVARLQSSADHQSGSQTSIPPQVTPHAYHVRAGGPNSYTLFTNAPESNRVSIAFERRDSEGVIFRLFNGERHAILIWNVRVQAPSTGAGTDGFGWDTIHDDYPVGSSRYPSPRCEAGAWSEFKVDPPREKSWRVCAIYSIDWSDSEKSYSGNYEAISPKLEPLADR